MSPNLFIILFFCTGIEKICVNLPLAKKSKNMKKYTEYKGLKLADISTEMKQYWEDHDIFAKSLKNREKFLKIP